MGFTEEHREKLRQAQLGKRRSDEHRAAIAAGMRRAWEKKQAARAREILARLKEMGPGIPAPAPEEDASPKRRSTTTG